MGKKGRYIYSVDLVNKLGQSRVLKVAAINGNKRTEAQSSDTLESTVTHTVESSLGVVAGRVVLASVRVLVTFDDVCKEIHAYHIDKYKT